MNENICKHKNQNLVNILQSFIYTMNDEKIREELIKTCIKNCNENKEWKWSGTWTVICKNNNLLMRETNECIKNFIKKKKFNSNVYRNCMFTVCIIYEIHLVHYVSFVYNYETKKLNSFDPGIELYVKGRDTVLPLIRKAFYELNLIEKMDIIDDENMGVCNNFKFKGKNVGIQYNNNSKMILKADSFCQTWTIYFLIRLMIGEKDYSFINNWCEINPMERERYLMAFFILPQLMYGSKNISKTFMKNYNIYNINQYNEIINYLYEYLEKCYPDKLKKNNNKIK